MSTTVFINTMARYRRYRKTVSAKPRYSSHTVTFQNADDTFSQMTNRFIAYYDFARTTPDSQHPPSAKVKVKRVTVQGMLGVYDPTDQVYSPGLMLCAEAIIIYMPQILLSALPAGEVSGDRESFTNLLIADHPEWIMARRYIPIDFVSGVPSVRKSVPFKLTTRLARNLNSGDTVMLIMRLTSHGSSPSTYQIAYNGAITYYTKDN